MRPNNRRIATDNSIQHLSSTKHYHEAPAYTKIDRVHDNSLHRSANTGVFPSVSPVSSVPPTLPPIPRITSQHGSHGYTDLKFQSSSTVPSWQERQQSDQESSNTKFSDNYAAQTPDSKFSKTSKNSSSQTSHPNPIYPYQLHEGIYRPINTHDSMKPNTMPLLSVPRPISAGPSLNIPQPRRPPPPPPTHSSHLETPSVNSGRHGRTKLNLLNPMSLLARRRSSQTVVEATLDKAPQRKNSGTPSLGLPDDYDPRIRGNVVHDFSAPRLGRMYDANERSKIQELQNTNQHRLSPNLNSSSSPEEDSPNSAEREHTPIFKEHFDDDIEMEPNARNGTMKQRASAFVYQVSLTESHPDPDPSFIPAFARNLPPRVSSEAESNHSSLKTPKIPLEISHALKLIEKTSAESSTKSSPPISPRRDRSRASSNSDSPFQPAGLPRHFKSNASRFSFDMAGVGSSAQEKLLEEKHRQKANRNAQEKDTPITSPTDESLQDVEDDEDNYYYEDIDEDDDGFEERIPGINTDSEDPPLSILNREMESFHFTSPIKSPLTKPVSPASGMTSLPTSRDNQGQPIGFAVFKSSPNLDQHTDFRTSRSSIESLQTGNLTRDSSLIISHGNQSRRENEDRPNVQPMAPLAGLPLSQYHNQDDDFYFDDGMIEDLDAISVGAFDESVFDDETNRKYTIASRHRMPTHNECSKNECQMNSLSSAHREGKVTRSLSAEHVDRFENATNPAQFKTQKSLLRANCENRTSFNQASDLTQDNLAAYHDALAFATNQAALNGEFNRRQSFNLPNQDERSDDLPGMTPDDGRGSQEINDLFVNTATESGEDFDFDDTLSDDPIIAAANAEVLENDDDGFYGQEFGFFARATGSGEYANGGYFGPRGIEGIGRSHSGRVNFQEPSLTPITERSEWSNRNSAISLAMLGYPQPAQPALSSPGLAQLADMLPLEEDNMSLSALMKLRRGAWGSSTTSLQSSSGSQISASPLNILPTILSSTTAPPTNSVHAHNFTSTHSLNSSSGLNSGSDSDASPSSPTVTIPSNKMLLSGNTPCPESSPNLPLPLHNFSDSHAIPTRPRSSHLVGKITGHSRNNSGAESVSYVHEKDTEGSGGRWVVEKRRLGEDGKTEVLEREVLEGGRI